VNDFVFIFDSSLNIYFKMQSDRLIFHSNTFTSSLVTLFTLEIKVARHHQISRKMNHSRKISRGKV